MTKRKVKKAIDDYMDSVWKNNSQNLNACEEFFKDAMTIKIENE